MDRLTNAGAYRPLREVRTLRMAEGDAGTLAGLLRREWGVEVRIPAQPRSHWGEAADFPVWRADGLEVLDQISFILGLVPLWRDGHVELAEAEAAVRQLKERR